MKASHTSSLAFLVVMTITATPLNAATVSITELEPVSNLSGTVYDLTALGTSDWVVYGGTTVAPSDEMNGGSGIGSLTYDPNGSSVTGVTNRLTGADPSYSWTNGTNVPSTSPVANLNVLVNANDATATMGQTFTLTIAGNTSPSQLYLWVGAENTFFDINASLSGAPTALFSNAGTGANSTQIGLYRIDFTADSPTDDLTVDLVRQSTTGGTFKQFGVQAAALTVVPEPSTFALMGIAGLAGLALMRKERR